MEGEFSKWMILVATIWIQAFTGTNFDFSAYSSDLKSVLGISQIELNYLATASDLGKVLGWSSGLALLYFPLWVVLFMAALMGFIGYGLQWLVIQNLIVLPYSLVFLLCLLAGCSICWFNTVCFVLCNKNFPTNRALALSLTISFNGLSPAIYNLAAKTISSNQCSIFLLLNSFLPLIISLIVIFPILRKSIPKPPSIDALSRDSFIFLLLNVIAVFTGLYLLLLNKIEALILTARILFGGAILLLLLPLCVSGVVSARNWSSKNIFESLDLQGSGFNLVGIDDLELHRELLIGREDYYKGTSYSESEGSCYEKNRLLVLGQEHSAQMVLRRLDFWFYYIAYLCGGTIGLVYSNNLGQISQSLGFGANTTELLTLYSSCSFFGRLLSAAPDFMRLKVYFARTGWLAIALVPMPIAFFLLASSGSKITLELGTALVGLSSGFIFAAAVSITSELFGPNSVGVNHNILITNIPLGSLLYGLLSAIVYDSNASSSIINLDAALVCMGRKCYFETFLWWGSISLLGLASSGLLFVRTKPAYSRFEENRVLQSGY